MSPLDTLEERFDVVIVGAGASGATLAWTLVQNSNLKILVVESGGAEKERSITEVPRADSPHEGERWFNAQLGTRSLQVPRGAGLGGSMQINGGYFLWPDPQEIARWDASGTWGTSDVAASFTAVTTNGDGGPLVDIASAEVGGIGQLFIEACVADGIPLIVDKNSAWSGGVGPLVMNTRHGDRSTPGDFFRKDVPEAHNVAMVTHSNVQRVLFAGHDVVGVELVSETDGSVHQIETNRVVICAGSIETPEILIRSGIGPSQVLADLGIAPLRIVDGLGQRAWEHPVVELPIMWAGRHGVELDRLVSPQHFGIAAHLEINDQIVELMPLLRPYSNDLHGSMLLPIRCTLMTPTAPSQLRFAVQQPEPKQQNILTTTICYGHLEQEQDRQALHQALLVAMDLADRLIARLDGEFVMQVDSAARDAVRGGEWEHWLHHNIDTAHHLMGTAPMGPVTDPFAVVNARGKVHEVQGLWVGDVSIIPEPLSRGTAATAVMIGHRIGSMLCDQELK